MEHGSRRGRPRGRQRQPYSPNGPPFPISIRGRSAGRNPYRPASGSSSDWNWTSSPAITAEFGFGVPGGVRRRFMTRPAAPTPLCGTTARPPAWKRIFPRRPEGRQRAECGKALMFQNVTGKDRPHTPKVIRRTTSSSQIKTFDYSTQLSCQPRRDRSHHRSQRCRQVGHVGQHHGIYQDLLAVA